MICVECQGRSLADCRCPDLVERLTKIAESPHVAIAPEVFKRAAEARGKRVVTIPPPTGEPS